jgi:hypothetical protein
VPSPETISHEIAKGQSNESASSCLAAGYQRKHKKRDRIPPVVKYIGQPMHDANSGAKTIRHLTIVRRVHAQRNGEHPVHTLEQRFVKFDRAEFGVGMI